MNTDKHDSTTNLISQLTGKTPEEIEKDTKEVLEAANWKTWWIFAIHWNHLARSYSIFVGGHSLTYEYHDWRKEGKKN